MLDRKKDEEVGGIPQQWNEPTLLYVFHKKSDKIICSNYRGISLLPTTYKMLSKNKFVSRQHHWGASV
jgi:hypothetical protein